MDPIKTEVLADIIPHISFGPITELGFSNNQIIWSPNGTGKTSIVKALESLGSLPISFADLEASRSDFIKNGKQLTIGLGIKRINQLVSVNNAIVDSCDVKRRLKAAGLNNQANAKKLLPKFPRCTSDPSDTFLAFQRKAASRIIGLLPYGDLEFYVAHREQLNELSDTANEIRDLKEMLVNRALETLSQAIDPIEGTCPVCGNKTSRPILNILKEKIEAHETGRENLASRYSKIHPTLTAEEVERAIVELARINATDSELLSYCLSQGNSTKCESVSRQKTQYLENMRLIETLSKENERFFTNLKTRREEIRELFSSRFKVSSLVFDDKSRHLIIDLPRNVETYSTGEINLMITLVRINEFLASDNEVLVFDDPLSSLDRANQYLVMFELIRVSRNPSPFKKNITIFTHNMDCITIAESQYRHSFSYYCMEKLNDVLILNPIESDFFDTVKKACKNPNIDHQGARPGALSAESLLLYRKQQTSIIAAQIVPYLDLLRDRDIADDPNAHEVFHYRGSFTHPTCGLSNDNLVEYIDSFDINDISKTSFADRTLQKIFTFLALRVWVEKQLFDLYPELLTNQDKSPLQLGELIKQAFELGWRGAESVSREFLNSKKTMLNHNAHAKAQASPFDFAINLSITDICSEVKEIKDRFVS